MTTSLEQKAEPEANWASFLLISKMALASAKKFVIPAEPAPVRDCRGKPESRAMACPERSRKGW